MTVRESPWPVSISIPLPEYELPEGVSYATRDVQCVPAELARELFGVLRRIHTNHPNGFQVEDIRAAEKVLARYEQEVGS